MHDLLSATVPGHVLMISEHASPLAALGGADGGGQNVYVAQLARHLARRGWRVDVATRRDAPDLPDEVEWLDGVRVLHVPAGPAEAVPKEDLLSFMPDFARWTEAHCREAQPDLIHANFFMSGLVAAEVRAATGLPFAVTFHALGRVRRQHQGEADRFPPARLAIEERVAREAALVIAECPQDREDLTTLYGVDPARICEVPCGVDPAELAPLPRAVARDVLGLPREPFVALQLGRMVPRKGVDDALRGFARFRHDTGADALLLVVGGESAVPDPEASPELARLMAVARDEGIEDAVRFTGARDRDVLRYYYHAADAFLTLPWYEPFGITPLEAMACARPVIGAAVGGIKHTVQDGRTGLLVPPRDPEAVAAALARLHADPDAARAMGAEGRARVLARFTWEAVADGIEAAFAEIRAGAAIQAGGAIGAPGTGRSGGAAGMRDAARTSAIGAQGETVRREVVPTGRTQGAGATSAGRPDGTIGRGGAAATARSFPASGRLPLRGDAADAAAVPTTAPGAPEPTPSDGPTTTPDPAARRGEIPASVLAGPPVGIGPPVTAGASATVAASPLAAGPAVAADPATTPAPAPRHGGARASVVTGASAIAAASTVGGGSDAAAGPAASPAERAGAVSACPAASPPPVVRAAPAASLLPAIAGRPAVSPLPAAGPSAASPSPTATAAPTASPPPGAASAPAAAGFDELGALLARCRDALAPGAARLAEEVARCILRGGKLLLCGNGGSAADAQHMACELVGRFLLPQRRALPAIALGSDGAVVSAWSNDVGYEDALAREALALGRPGDAILAFSTSGRSANLMRAFEAAGELGLTRLALLGRDGGPLLALCDHAVVVPSSSTPRIQEVHALLMHEICTAVEADARLVAPAPALREAAQ